MAASEPSENMLLLFDLALLEVALAALREACEAELGRCSVEGRETEAPPDSGASGFYAASGQNWGAMPSSWMA